ncbi:hypothetical protein HDU96_005650 [Phlyctochytrium bullatum]|nr:hypothetical protein HDU96_005650 [Phlyctochytrium bullatum]
MQGAAPSSTTPSNHPQHRPSAPVAVDPVIRSYYLRHPSIAAMPSPSSDALPPPPPTTTTATTTTATIPEQPTPLQDQLSRQLQLQQDDILPDNDTTPFADPTLDSEDSEDDDSDYEDTAPAHNPFVDQANNPYGQALQDTPSSTAKANRKILEDSGLDFSKINLSEYSPEELEALYKAKHLGRGGASPQHGPDSLGFNPNSYPTSMTVTIERVELPSRASDRPLLYRVVFRGRKLEPIPDAAAPTRTPSLSANGVAPISPTPTPSLPKLSQQMVYRAPLTYHSLLFDLVKIDVHDLPRSPLLPYTHLGRARIRLADLDSLNGSLVATFPLHPRRSRRRANNGAPPAPTGHIVVSFDFARAVEDDADDSIHPDDSASLFGDDDDDASIMEGPTTPRKPGATKAVVEEFMGYFRAVESSDIDTLARSRSLPTDTVSTSTGPDRKPTLFGFGPKRANTLASGGSTAPGLTRVPSLAPSQTLAGTVLRFDSSDDETTSTTVSSRTKRGLRLLSDRTRLGIAELSAISAAFFHNGWPISKTEFVRALLFVGRWQLHHQANPRTHDAVTDPRRIRVATYFLRFTTATYGSVVMNFLGAGKGYIRDTLRGKADRKTATDYLGIREEDMVVWEFAGMEAFRPKFFICYDEKTMAVVLSVRGTLNIHDCLTDICAEYEPHGTGYIHRGMLRCALWLEQHALPSILSLLRQRRARALYLVGHSLGGSIASVLTMLLRDNPVAMAELRAASGCADKSKFRMHCFAIAPAPACSAEMAEGLVGWVDSFVNENDTVPRLSYGAVCDFRDLILKADEVLKKKMSETDRFESLTTLSTHLATTNAHPKVYIPGTVHYVYKTSRVLKRRGAVPESGVPAVDDTRPHYVLERSDRSRFLTVQVKLDMLWDHIPSKYENALKKAHDWLVEHQPDEAEEAGYATPPTSPAAQKSGGLFRFGRRG